jgi:hypothetical protein
MIRLFFITFVATCVSGFHTSPSPFCHGQNCLHNTYIYATTISTTALHAKQRKAKQKVQQSRPKSFYDEVDSASLNKTRTDPESPTKEEIDAQRKSVNDAAQARFDERPEVTSLVVDENGRKVLVQGKNVMDVVTRKAVKLSTLGPVYRLAQMFPGVPPDVREKHRLDWNTVEVPEIVEALRKACSVKLEDGTRGIPLHPSVASAAIDFVLANRDQLGRAFKSVIGRLTLRAMSEFKKEEASKNMKLWRNYLTIENHISAPFRQMILDAEGRVGPNFGNLDIMSYCKGDLYERCANYLVLKGMVAHWEKKVRDADIIEKTPLTDDNYVRMLCTGDPRRFLPDPPILFTLKDCTRVCVMAQQLTKLFVDTPELFSDFPPELKFLEAALAIRGGTGLRKFMIEEFCPAEEITPEALREGMKRLLAQMENLQIDPYADLSNLLEKLIIAMSKGTVERPSPYIPYVKYDPKGPGAFQTYTFNADRLSLVRFLDSRYAGIPVDPIPQQNPFDGLLNMVKQPFGITIEISKPQPNAAGLEETEKEEYKVPALRAIGRPHEMGWLELLDDEENDPRMDRENIQPGKIITENE